jgi:signal transduction histidine kinase
MLEWGSHFCHLYRSREDVLETLVPFFAAGLENNEQCLWVTSDPVGTEDATLALAQRVSGLQSKIDRGQVRIVDQSDWYSRIGNRNADSVLNAWLDAEQSARAQGYSGLRLTGNVSFLKTSGQWREFERYEARVSDAFAGRRLIGACGYNLESTRVADVLDLVRDHQFTLVRREDKWEVLENVATKPARSELSRVNAELEQRVRERTAELELALQERDIAARAKDEFLATLAHELRNPLAPMANALQVMRLRGMDSREHGILVRQVTHLTRLVDDLLDVSRIGRGRIDLRKRPVEFSHVVIRAIELVSPLLEQRQQLLEVAVPRAGLLVDVDVERMAQVLGNLLTNASKYSEPRTRILLTARRERTQVRCLVSDEGMGIAPEMLQNIFDPFVQQPQGLERSRGGLGLGLAIVRSLVAQHNGSVHAESQGVGCGSTFVVELPLMEPQGQVGSAGWAGTGDGRTDTSTPDAGEPGI